MSEHEVGENTGGAPGHPHLTVDQHLAPSSQSQVYEVNNIVEVDGDVSLGNINNLQTFVGDAPGFIEILTQKNKINFQLFPSFKSYCICIQASSIVLN